MNLVQVRLYCLESHDFYLFFTVILAHKTMVDLFNLLK
jgi:hypothetical protein